MSNWFEKHPATSIITYTIFIAGATWAASTFVLQDNRLNLAKSELESQKTLAEQYKSKSEILQKDLEVLRAENQEYRNWLAQSKDAIPIMIPQLVELKKKIAQLNNPSPSESFFPKQSPQQPATEDTQTTELPAPYKGKPKLLPKNFNQSRMTKLGTAAVDESTGVVVTVKQTSPDRTAILLLKLPGRNQVLEKKVFAGEQFTFKWGGRNIILTILEIQFYGDVVVFNMHPSDA